LSPEENSYVNLKPICPHCSVEPCILAGHMVMMGGMPFVEILCSSCRKILGVNLVPIPQEPQPAPIMSNSRIIMPS